MSPSFPLPNSSLSTLVCPQISQFVILRLAVSDLLCCESSSCWSQVTGPVTSERWRPNSSGAQNQTQTTPCRSHGKNYLKISSANFPNFCSWMVTEHKSFFLPADKYLQNSLQKVWAMAAESVWLWNKCRTTTKSHRSRGSERNSCDTALAPVSVKLIYYHLVLFYITNWFKAVWLRICVFVNLWIAVYIWKLWQLSCHIHSKCVPCQKYKMQVHGSEQNMFYIKFRF